MTEDNGFVTENGVLIKYTGYAPDVTVPEGITAVAEGAFAENGYLRRVVLPQSLRQLGARAFFRTGLREIVLPTGVRRIEPMTFAECMSLMRVTLPEGLRSIGEGAFRRCCRLRELPLPQSLTAIGGEAFLCSGLEAIVFPSRLRAIGARAFMQNGFLEKAAFPRSGLARLGAEAFRECPKLADYHGLLIIKNRLFCFWNNYANGGRAVLPDGLRRIERGAFAGGASRIEMSLDCPEWEVAQPPKGPADCLLWEHGSTLAFRGADGAVVAEIPLFIEGETEPAARRARSAIRLTESGFDFEGYDRVFAALQNKQNKIGAALARLRLPYALSPQMEAVYSRFLRRNIADAAEILLRRGEAAFLLRFCRAYPPSAGALVPLTALAQRYGEAELTAYLLSVRPRSRAGKNASALQQELPPEKPDRAAVEQRYRARRGVVGDTVTEYTGASPEAVLPEKLGGRFTDGLASFAFCGNRGVRLQRITVPGWYSRFEDSCFAFLSDAAVEFREGIVSLPPGLFLVANRVTVRLPRSLNALGDQRLEDPQYGSAGNRYLVPRGSRAQRLCEENGWRYEIYSDAPDALDARGPQALAEIAALAETAAAAGWRRPGPGCFAVGRYLGASLDVTFPLSVGGVPIEGAADTGGGVPENYTRLRSVRLPEGYRFVGRQAFAGCGALETVVLPASLREIRGRAFAGCRALKTLYLRGGVKYTGRGIFEGAQIDTLILETVPGKYLPAHLFYGCRIRRLVVLGGGLLCGGSLFWDVRRPEAALNFPQEVYMNGCYRARDLYGRGGVLLPRLRPLSAFDESTLEDAALRAATAEGKRASGPAFDHASLLVSPDPPPESIRVAGERFVFYNRYDEACRGELARLGGAILRRGGAIGEKVSPGTDYLILPDAPALQNTLVREALRLRGKGCGPVFLRRSDLAALLGLKINDFTV